MRAFHLLPLALFACNNADQPSQRGSHATYEHRDDLHHLYDSAAVTGSFILHDMGRDHWVFIDSAHADVPSLPASTFKLFSSLYALESGVATDADAFFMWDGVDYGRPQVNRGMTLRESVEQSAYWVHRDIARKAGAATLKHWLDAVSYGNADTSGGYDCCWVRGNLRITPRQQVDFLERLHGNSLPFSTRSMDIVRSIALQQDTLGYRLHGKTGWALGSTGSVGWFVGWVDKVDGTGPFVFANRIQTADTLSETFPAARRGIAIEVLTRLGVLPE